MSSIRSMTGFGMGVASVDGLSIQSEVHCVNHRQLSITVNLPSQLAALESRAMELVEGAFSRGRVTLGVRMLVGGARTETLVVHEDLARDAIEACQSLARAHGLDSAFSISEILRIPGVIEIVPRPLDAQMAWPVLDASLRAALDEAQAMRNAEGHRLCQAIQGIGREIAEVVAAIEQAVYREGPSAKSRLEEKLRSLLGHTPIEPALLMNEVALLALKGDITEEVTRIRSHLEAISRIGSDQETSPGRKLDFLAQEIGRESSTIAAKAGVWHCTDSVVTLRTLAEGIRQQASNLE